LTKESDGPEDRPDPTTSLDVRALLVSGMGLAPAGANVIMQLSRLPIGHAVAESKVESGSLSRHPVKRTRTTLAYIMISLLGTDDERANMRREVNAVHRRVRSDEDSAVEYDALDPELQLWVAACMFRGVIDALTFLVGPVEEATYATLLQCCSSFGTTLQVPDSRWPLERATFEEYWSEAIGLVHMDETTRRYLRGLASLEFLPAILSRTLGPAHRFLTTGFLPPTFREELGYSWTSRNQARFEMIISKASVVNRHLPKSVREFPWNLVEWDTRRRIARGRSVL
jgi:uncharacterized protein (DUF2236 family)